MGVLVLNFGLVTEIYFFQCYFCSACMFGVYPYALLTLGLFISLVTGHEAYLQLKETEYVQGLDVVYIVSGFHIFSSFKLKAAHFRAAMHLLKFVAIILYAALFNYNLIQVWLGLLKGRVYIVDQIRYF